VQNSRFLQANDLDLLLNRARERFQVGFETVRIGDISLELLQIANLDEYIDYLAETSKERIDLPFWAKIWPASILLSYHLLSLPPANKHKNVLELGAGLGLCGLCAAARGYQVTITDNHEDALLFSNINILKNNLQDRARVQAVDFTRDELSGAFTYIIGAEILYLDSYYPALVAFLKNHLASGSEAEILLSASLRRKPSAFFQKAQKEFSITYKNVSWKERAVQAAEGENEQVTIYRLKSRT